MSVELTGNSVILVVADSVRADMFHEEANNFRALSREGLAFTKAIAPAAWTLPSHVSMFTGMRPTEHRAVARGGSKVELRSEVRAIVDDIARTDNLLAPRLQKHGLRTFSSTPNPWLGPLTGLHRGFEERRFFGFLDVEGSSRHSPKSPPNSPGRVQQVRGVTRAIARHARWVAAGKDKGARQVLDALTQFVHQTSKPFFAFVNLIEAHEPHVHPPTKRRWKDPDYVKAAANAIFQPGPIRAQRVRHHNWGARQIPDRLLARWTNAYRSEIRYLDTWLLELTNMLESTGRLSTTIVITTSDHGENFGEGGSVGHGVSLRESTAHVPLGIWGADVRAAIIDVPVSLLGVRATVEELTLGIQHEDSLLRGGTGVASIEIEDPAHVNRPPRGATRASRGPGAAFYDGNLKLVVDPFDGEALYDLARSGSEPVAANEAPTDGQRSAKREWEARINARG